MLFKIALRAFSSTQYIPTTILICLNIHPTIVYYKCYIPIGYSAVVYCVIDHGSRKSKGKQYGYTAENSRFAEVSEEFS
jgi:hypothetical protein